MKRFVNFRPLLIIFLTFIGAVYSVINAFLGKFLPLGIFASVSALFLILFFVSIIKKDFLDKLLYVFGIKSLTTLCAIFLITAAFSSAVAAITFDKCIKRDLPNGYYSITADIKEVVKYDTKTNLLLCNVKIEDKYYSFNIQASASSGSYAVGDKLNFESYIYASKLIDDDSINTYILKTNVQYYCKIYFDNVIKSEGGVFFTDYIKDKTKNILQDNMNEENAGFAYAVVCGDKSILTSEYSEIFRNGGLAHILAVSGLHIGFLVAAIVFVLKRLNVKSKYQFCTVFAILSFYNIMCNFAPSVLRASIMSLCMLLGFVLGKRNDTLSNISLAGIIILTIQPLYLYDVGFLLSFGSVYGIILFSKPLSNVFKKIKIPKFLSDSLAVTISATMGTIPWICKYFHVFAPISFLSNLIVLPLFSIMFVFLLFSISINMLFSMPIFLMASEFFVNIVVNFSRIFAKFGVINTVSFSTLTAILYYVIAFFASPYFMQSFKSKVISILCLTILLTCMISFDNLNSSDESTIKVNSNLTCTANIKTENASGTNMFLENNNEQIINISFVDNLIDMC